MIEYLSKDEKHVLNVIKESYDRNKTNPLTSIQPQLELKIEKDAITPLQEKGYIVINKTDLGTHLEIVSITLKDKFFTYFNI